MRLDFIQLENIRSYLSEKVEFPTGMLLLSGDIGAGKSTLLQSIEFALFGHERGNAGQLLRHGEQKGKVVLQFSIENKTYTIERKLARTKSSIVQQTAKLTTDGVEQELATTELNTAVLEILGYPTVKQQEAMLVYRYTVYASQERMKDILFEEPTSRLQTLRTLFGIEKYKQVSVNSALVAKEFRSFVRNVEPQIQDLQYKNEELAKTKAELVTVEKQKIDFDKEVEQKLQQATSKKEEIDKHEQNINQIREFNSVQDKLILTKQQLEQRNTQVKNEISKTEEQINSLKKQLLDFPKVNLQEGKQKLEELSNIYVQKQKEQSIVQEKVTQAKKQIDEKKVLANKLQDIINQFDAKQVSQIQKQVSQLEDFEKQKTLLTTQKESLQNQIALTKQRITHAQDALKQLCEENCPVCKQKVSGNITSDYESQIEQDTQGLQIGEKRLGEITDKLKDIDSNITHTRKLKEELGVLVERAKDIELKKEELTQIKQQQQDLDKIATQPVLDISELNTQVEKQKQTVVELEKVQSQKEQVQTKCELFDSSLQKLQTELNSNAHKISQITVEPKKDIALPEEQLKQFKADYEVKREKLEEARIASARVIQQITALNNREKELNVDVEKLKKLQEQIATKKQYALWLKNKFIPVVDQIEKAVFSKVYAECNEYFTKWFMMLSEDEFLQAKLDSQFTPIIMQNGYETTFANLSGGEKTSVALAYRLALNKVVNDISKDIKTKDLLILDEPTDGFSTEQLDRVRDVLHQLETNQLVMVSHEPKIETFVDHILRIEKQNHQTNIKQS